MSTSELDRMWRTLLASAGPGAAFDPIFAMATPERVRALAAKRQADKRRRDREQEGDCVLVYINQIEAGWFAETGRLTDAEALQPRLLANAIKKLIAEAMVASGATAGTRSSPSRVTAGNDESAVDRGQRDDPAKDWPIWFGLKMVDR